MFKALFAIQISASIFLFSQLSTAAAVYRLSHVDSDSEVARPVSALPSRELVFRMINLSGGAPFSSFNSEFLVRKGRLHRIKSQKVNHVMEMSLDRINENLRCEQDLSAGLRIDHIDPGEAWRERTVGPVDRQALLEMNARKYIEPEQMQSYLGSTSMVDADRMIYFESLSWYSAAELLKAFDQKIPWARVSEVEGPAGLGSFELRRLAEAGDQRFRLRLRRATLRLVAGHWLYADHAKVLQFVDDPLPFEVEYSAQGIAIAKDPDEIIYRFELGRASQIPGFEGEAERLSAIAGLAMWHNAMSYEDIRTGQKTDIRAVDANIYMHALKRTHQWLYANAFGASHFAQGNVAHDSVLRTTLKQFLAKTLPKAGLGNETLRDIAVKSDSLDFLRWDFDWKRGDQLMTRYHPITVRVARRAAVVNLKDFSRDVDDRKQRSKWIASSLNSLEHFSGFKFPETRAVDAYDPALHSKISADLFVSGLDMWSATNPGYGASFAAALITALEGANGKAEIVVILPHEISGGRQGVFQLLELGFKSVPRDPQGPDYYGGPFAVTITLDRLRTLGQSHPEVARELSFKPEVKSGTWRHEREMALLPGL